MLARAENQPQRADISKMIVHRSARKKDGAALPIAAAEARHMQGLQEHRSPQGQRARLAGRLRRLHVWRLCGKVTSRGIAKPHLCS